jgi:hypothetical protein
MLDISAVNTILDVSWGDLVEINVEEKKENRPLGQAQLQAQNIARIRSVFSAGEQKHIGFELNIRLYYEDCLVAIFEDKTGTETRLFVAHRRQALHIESEIPRRSAGLCSSPAYQRKLNTSDALPAEKITCWNSARSVKPFGRSLFRPDVNNPPTPTRRVCGIDYDETGLTPSSRFPIIQLP